MKMKTLLTYCIIPALTLLIGTPHVSHTQTPVGLLFFTDYESVTDPNILTGAKVWQAEQEPNAPGASGPLQTARITVTTAPGSITDPYRPSTKVMRVELRPKQNTSIVGADEPNDGDVQGSKYNRAEVYARHAVPGSTPAEKWPDPVGSTRWYGWSTYIPTDFVNAPSNAYWFDFLQLKGFRGGSPPMAMELHSGKVAFKVNDSYYTVGPMDKGTWVRYVVGVKLATDTTGWVQVYRNGKQVVNQSNLSTMDIVNGAVDPIYLKQGIYRSGDWAVTHVLYHGPMKIGLNYSAVAVN
jgi:hypothetical protein